MRYILFIIIFLFTFSISCKSDNQPEPKMVYFAQASAFQIETGNPQVVKINEIVNKVKNDEMEMVEGLNYIDDLLKAIEDEEVTDEENVDDKNADGEHYSLVVELVEAISSLASNQAEKIKILSILYEVNEGYYGPVAGVETLKKQLNILFLSLINRIDELSNKDHLFILYFMHAITTEWDNNTFNDSVASTAVVQYYQKLLSAKIVEVNAKKDSWYANRLFRDYALLKKVIKAEIYLYKIFEEIMPLINFKTKTASFMMFECYSRLLGTQLRISSSDTNLLLTQNNLDSVLELGKWAVDTYVIKDPNLPDAFDHINRVNAFFERDPKMFSEVSLQKWVEALDERFEKVMFPLWRTLTVSNENLNNYYPKHFYTRLYFNRAHYESNPEAIIDIDNYDNLKQECYKSISRFNGKSEINENNYSVEEIKKFNYLHSFYDVDLRRFYLEQKGAVIGEVKSSNDVRNKVYEESVKSLLNVLNIRYTKNINYEDFKHSPVEFANTYLDREIQNSSKDDFRYEIDLCHGQNDLDKCSDKELKAGIYTTLYRVPMEIKARDIKFSPLTMLINPGNEIKIEAKSLLMPWIDTTPANIPVAVKHSGNSDIPPRPKAEGGYIAIHKDNPIFKLQKKCINPRPLATPYVYKCRNNGLQFVIEYHNPTRNFDLVRYSRDPLNYDRPVKQSRGDNADNAGNISIFAKEIIGAIMLVAKGGMGGNGVKGDSAFHPATYISTLINRAQLHCANVHDPDPGCWHQTDQGNGNILHIFQPGKGGEGGNAGNGGQIELNISQVKKHMLVNLNVSQGITGKAGEPGEYIDHKPTEEEVENNKSKDGEAGIAGQGVIK